MGMRSQALREKKTTKSTRGTRLKQKALRKNKRRSKKRVTIRSLKSVATTTTRPTRCTKKEGHKSRNRRRKKAVGRKIVVMGRSMGKISITTKWTLFIPFKNNPTNH
jgi:hypothetical protein